MKKNKNAAGWEEAGLDPYSVGRKELREALRMRGTMDVPKMDFWRPKYLRKLLWKRRDVLSGRHTLRRSCNH